MKKVDREQLGDAILAILGLIAIATAVVVAVLVIIWFCRGIQRSWTSAMTIDPQEQAEIDKANAEWEKDPRNPKVVGQKCLDMGGIPDYSAWDGDVKACRGAGNNKSVNIEVNQ